MENNDTLSPEPVEKHLAARSVAHGSILRVLVASAIERDPALGARLVSIMERDLGEIQDEALAALVEREFRSIVG